MSSEISYERNSTGWAIDRFRSDALPRLIDDLGPLSLEGIPEEICQQVKAALEAIVNQAALIPDKSVFRKSIWEHLQAYAEDYSAWNDVKGTDSVAIQRRKEIIQRLREHRNRIATASRTNIHILNRELDLAFIDSLYASFRKLVEAVPRSFEKLASAVKRYDKRRK